MTKGDRMLGICEQYKKSGLSLKAYCDQNGLSSRILRYWLGKMDNLLSSRSNFLKIKNESVFESKTSNQILEIEYPNGVKVRASLDFEVVRNLISLV